MKECRRNLITTLDMASEAIDHFRDLSKVNDM